jgi:hypothetical protein
MKETFGNNVMQYITPGNSENDGMHHAAQKQ